MIDLLIALGALGRYAAAWKALLENNIAEHTAGATDETAEGVRLRDELDAARGAVPHRLARWTPRIDARTLRETDYYRRMGASS